MSSFSACHFGACNVDEIIVDATIAIITFTLEDSEPHRSSVTIPPHGHDSISRFLPSFRSERDFEEIDSEQARLRLEVSVVHEIAKRGVELSIASSPEDHNSCLGMGASTLGVQLRFPHAGAEQFHASAGDAA
ncbi:hypothetical protein [Burkholderia ubonensis]|uniref:hypothetical protein n=1 Tax=Burkholderia ubonensis TaxID=101571 RepID=UPI0012FCE3F0|nr:hypothetical protein [Burkholderia ubonensis]